MYTLTNSAAGNAVLAFARAADGTLTAQGTYATGGLGSGAALGSQGAVILSDERPSKRPIPRSTPSHVSWTTSSASAALWTKPRASRRMAPP